MTWTARIRSATHAGPSRRGWAEISSALDEADDPTKLAEMIRFVDKHTSTWPADLRVAPISWWLDALAGRDLARFSLARALDLTALQAGALRGPRLAAALAESGSTRQLLHLHLGGLALGDQGARTLAESPRLAQLVTLDLAANELTVEGARALASSRWLNAVSTLVLSRNAGIDAAAIEALFSGTGLRALTELHLDDCPLGVEGARAIARAERSAQLTALRLDGTSLEDHGVAALAASEHLGRLGALSLARNRLEPVSARALAHASRLKELGSLDLDQNVLGDEGAIELANGPLIAQLGVLSLARSFVGEPGRAALAARAPASLTINY